MDRIRPAVRRGPTVRPGRAGRAASGTTATNAARGRHTAATSGAQRRPDQTPRPPRERPIDPDSPFAALAALKRELEKSQGRMSEPAAQRIDKWLWHARFARTRAAAQTLAESGHVRINRDKTHAASRRLRTGDVLTIASSQRRAGGPRRAASPNGAVGASATPGLLYEDNARANPPSSPIRRMTF